MFDYRLKVFLSVAQRLSFSKASEELFISQPAVSKHIKTIEQHYQCALFERNGNTLKITRQGEILKKYALSILSLHNGLDNEISFHNSKHFGIINIGASTTASQYVLPQYLASFKKNNPHIQLTLKTGNTENIENLLLHKKIDIGIVEGKSKRHNLEYVPFQKDEIILCTHKSTHSKSVLSKKDLVKIPFIVRESGSGTLDIIRAALAKNKVKLEDLKVEMILENNESIKTYLENSNAFAFISISAIVEELKNDQLKIIDVENLSMERFYYVVFQKETQNPLVSLFKAALLNNQ